jgi:hypothetical protein
MRIGSDFSAMAIPQSNLQCTLPPSRPFVIRFSTSALEQTFLITPISGKSI